MRLLLDTHVATWLADRPHELSEGELALIGAADQGLLVSVISLWELRLKWDKRYASGDRKRPLPPEALLLWLRQNDVEVVHLTTKVAIASLDPPLAHSDPFDELLLIQAQQGGCRLLTRDRKLAGHPIALLA